MCPFGRSTEFDPAYIIYRYDKKNTSLNRIMEKENSRRIFNYETFFKVAFVVKRPAYGLYQREINGAGHSVLFSLYIMFVHDYTEKEIVSRIKWNGGIS
jgi:hypothetical protein